MDSPAQDTGAHPSPYYKYAEPLINCPALLLAAHTAPDCWQPISKNNLLDFEVREFQWRRCSLKIALEAKSFHENASKHPNLIMVADGRITQAGLCRLQLTVH